MTSIVGVLHRSLQVIPLPLPPFRKHAESQENDGQTGSCA